MLRIFLTVGVLCLSVVPASAAVRSVPAGGDLQAALNAAQPGDEIRLAAGATFTGNFVLPVQSGAVPITLRTDLPDASLPGLQQRVTPATAAGFAKIVSPNTAAALRTAPGAHHWTLMFLEFPSTQDGYGDILQLGDGSNAQTQTDQVPHDLVLDHIYIHGSPLEGQKRGIALNAGTTTIRNCYVSDIKTVGADSQAIGGWNGPGPYSIENNYLEAAGEVLLLGGSDPSIPNLVTQDVAIHYNHMTRPMAWRAPIIDTPPNVTAAPADGGSLAAGTYAYRIVAVRAVGSGNTGHSLASGEATVTSPGGSVTIAWSPVSDASSYQVYGRTPGGASRYWTVTGTSFTDTGAGGTPGAAPTDGTVWQVKNLLELKNARRVQVQYNLFENNWMAAQPGYAILFTPRNQDGACTWCVVASVEFSHNIVRNSAAGVNILGYDSPNPSQQTNDIRILDNLFYGLTTANGGNGWGIQIGDQPRDVAIDHNTFDFDGTTLLYAYGGTETAPRTIEAFVFTNNAGPNGSYGINGASASPGTLALQMYFPGAVITGNWLSGAPASRYPAGNRFDAPFSAFVPNRSTGDYTLSGALAAAGADGRPVGADVSKLLPLLITVPQGLMGTLPQAPKNMRFILSGQ